MGKLLTGENPRIVWDGSAVIGVPQTDNPDRMFGVLVDTESGLPDIAPGELLICDLDAPATPGRIIIAIDTVSQTAHIGRYRPSDASGDTARFSVAPINQDYPEVHFSEDRPGIVYARAIKHIRQI